MHSDFGDGWTIAQPLPANPSTAHMAPPGAAFVKGGGEEKGENPIPECICEVFCQILYNSLIPP